MKFIITESKLNSFISDWLSNNFGDLKPVVVDLYPNQILFMLFDRVIFSYDEETKSVSISYHTIYKHLIKIFHLDDEKSNEFIKNWLRKDYDLDVDTVIPTRNYV